VALIFSRDNKVNRKPLHAHMCSQLDWYVKFELNYEAFYAAAEPI